MRLQIFLGTIALLGCAKPTTNAPDPLENHPAPSSDAGATAETTSNSKTNRAAVAAFLADADAALATLDPDEAEAQGLRHDGNRRRLPAKWCQEKIGGPAANECTITSIGQGSAAVITVVFGCEHEHCEFGQWVVTDARPPRKFDDVIGTVPIISPDGAYLYLGVAELSGPGTYEAALTRLPTDSLVGEVVAACAAPVISPGGKWIVCRDVDGHVHRMPIGGGKLEPVYQIKGEVGRSPHLGVSLRPVSFRGATEIEVTNESEDARSVETAPWSEN